MYALHLTPVHSSFAPVIGKKSSYKTVNTFLSGSQTPQNYYSVSSKFDQFAPVSFGKSRKALGLFYLISFMHGGAAGVG